jgi:hypothetical protein
VASAINIFHANFPEGTVLIEEELFIGKAGLPRHLAPWFSIDHKDICTNGSRQLGKMPW